ncbi:beta-glucosidase [Chitinophaga costaii]|uniref:beta-N-acetylhexosaminidase n=2 Tax=Chitinophaga costaii TaxID=1335309 RepID=A0A1C4ACB0_9BACT|nr:beta-glucosidase [Chitinophaga costaii]
MMYRPVVRAMAGICAVVALCSTAPFPGKPPRHKSQPAAMPGDAAQRWVDSVFNQLSPDERIAQLIMIRAHSNLGAEHVQQVVKDIQRNKIGGLVFFQGGPQRQAALTNYYQSISKTPLLIAIDAEWGLGMRLDSVTPFPKNVMIGATQDSSIAYAEGLAIGRQCKRLGVQINFAPDMDVNNNPNNPVINDRSYGENKYNVASLGVAAIHGMQDAGIMASAKHFPGHGDTEVDSHLDLPSITKTMAQLDSLELYPFRQAIAAGVSSVMVAHLFVPAIDPKPHTPTSISRPAVTGLLRGQLGYQGVVVTDALEMKGLSKYYSKGQESLQSLLAGNDLLELPSTASGSVAAIRKAIRKKKISWDEVNVHVKKVLLAKYQLGLANLQPIDTNHLTEDLNAGTDILRQQIANKAITVVKNENRLLPFTPATIQPRVAVVALGISKANVFVQQVKNYRPDAATYLFSNAADTTQARALLAQIREQHYQAVIISLHNYNRRPAHHFDITDAQLQLMQQLQQELPSVTVFFGNAYAIQYACSAPAIVASYEDDDITQATTARILFGQLKPQGRLPVTVCPGLLSGQGITYALPAPVMVPHIQPEAVHMHSSVLARIDSLTRDAIDKGAMPGCSIFAMKDGQVVYQRQFGTLDPDRQEPVTQKTIYDLASVTKICATTLSVMKLYDEGKIKLNATLGQYLPWVKGTDKAKLKIRDILLHQAGLVPFIPFYKTMLDAQGRPDTNYFRDHLDSAHQVRVAQGLYLLNDYPTVMEKIIVESKLGKKHTYVYSDNDFIFLGKLVEQLTGQKLEDYVMTNFYAPLGLESTGFRPRERFTLPCIAPTENESIFRRQLIRGDVHDPGAAMFGGVAGHAGLFSDAQDLGIILQMLLNNGGYGGRQYIQPQTVKLFTAYNSDISRRGLGFDKPEKDNAHREYHYPCRGASAQTFGHTGFTGTCVWVDPKSQLVFVFLSNRVCPDGTNPKLSALHVRENIMQTLYDAMY